MIIRRAGIILTRCRRLLQYLYIPHIIDLHGQAINKHDLTVMIANKADISRYGHMHAGGFTIIGDEAGYFNLRFVVNLDLSLNHRTVHRSNYHRASVNQSGDCWFLSAPLLFCFLATEICRYQAACKAAENRRPPTAKP